MLVEGSLGVVALDQTVQGENPALISHFYLYPLPRLDQIMVKMYRYEIGHHLKNKS